MRSNLQSLLIAAVAVVTPCLAADAQTYVFRSRFVSAPATKAPDPVPVPAPTSGSRNGYDWRCAGGVNGKVCVEPQVRPASGVGWAAVISSRGTLPADQWFALWHSYGTDADAAFFCHVATGNPVGTVIARPASSIPRPFFSPKDGCTRSSSSIFGSCKYLAYDGVPDERLSFFASGTAPTIQLQCAGF